MSLDKIQTIAAEFDSSFNRNDNSIPVKKVFNDPFQADLVEDVYIFYSKSRLTKTWDASGTIEFKNGETIGKQKFNAASIEEILVKMSEFIKTLK